MLTKFQKQIQSNFPFLMGKRLLIACSGGADSVVLAHLCIQAGLEVTLAHCNFQLRGKESDADETFVRKLGKHLGVEVEVKAWNTQLLVKQNKGSVQMVARELRYTWFKELIQSGKYRYVLTAHHLDDDLETFLINLSRGTGIDGLLGIPNQNENVIRPLLGFSQTDILDFAAAEKLKWREDSSNQDIKYLRNRIRHKITPELKALHPTFLDNFKSTQDHLAQTNQLLVNHITQLKESLFLSVGGKLRIDIAELKKLNPLEAYLYVLFNEYGFTEWGDVKGLLTAMSGKEVQSNSYRLLKDRGHLFLMERESEEQINFQIGSEMTQVEYPIQLKFEIVDQIENTSDDIIFVDKEKLNYPLLLRKWEKGDYFYPFGMHGKKKLSKFFKDGKVDVFSKERQWLLCSGDAIVWVVGRRLDERFKVDGLTKKILKITFLV